MKTLIESLFDPDNITNGPPLTLETIKEQILISLKKYDLETVEWDDLSHGYIPRQPSIMIDDEDPDFFNINLFIPTKQISKYKHEEVCIGVTFTISKGDETDNQDPNSIYMTSVHAMWIEIRNKEVYPYSRIVWDRNGYKRYSKLKTNEFTYSSIKSIIKYIIMLFDKIIKLMNKDRSLIVSTYINQKDEQQYLKKIMKELLT